MKTKILIISMIGVFLLIQPISAQTWTAAKRLTWSSATSEYPSVAIGSGDEIHIVYDDRTPGNYEVYFKRSSNGGGSWITKRLTWSSGNSYNPIVAVDLSNHIHVVWQDNALSGNHEIYHKKSTDGGASWTHKRLTYSSGDSYNPAIAFDSHNHIHLVWSDWTNDQIYHKKSTDGGATWTTKRLTYSSGWSLRPAIAIDSNNHIHLVWHDHTPGSPEIYYKKSTDEGTTWTQKRLTYSSGDSVVSSIAVDSKNNIHVMWGDNTPGNYEIYYKKSTNGGANWTTKRLTYNSGWSSNPAIAIDSNNYIHLVWLDNSLDSNHEIYYKRSTDEGVTWTHKRLTHSSGYTGGPAIAVDSSDCIFVVWFDTTVAGFGEIYYRKGIQ
jgi:hypothetical protein